MPISATFDTPLRSINGSRLRKTPTMYASVRFGAAILVLPPVGLADLRRMPLPKAADQSKSAMVNGGCLLSDP